MPGLTIAYGGGGPHCITQQIPARVRRHEAVTRSLRASYARVDRAATAPFKVGAVQHRWHPDPDEHRAALAEGVRLAAGQAPGWCACRS